MKTRIGIVLKSKADLNRIKQAARARHLKVATWVRLLVMEEVEKIEATERDETAGG